MSESFHEVRLDPTISYGATGGPVFSTQINETAGGDEQRNQNWALARGRWDISHTLKDSTQIATLIAFFRARRGKVYGFRFKDWTDFQAIGTQIGGGDGTGLEFPLKKIYLDDINPYGRDITKPVQGTVVIYVNGTPQTEVTDYVIDYTTGTVTFTTPPASGIITADFEFDVPVRFDIDQMQVQIEFFETHNWASIPIVEIRDV